MYKIVEEGGKYKIVDREGRVVPGSESHTTLKSAEYHLGLLYAGSAIKEVSLDDRIMNIRRAVYNAMDSISTPTSYGSYIVNVYEGYVIVSWGKTYYKIPYTETNGVVVVSSADNWVEVELIWVERENAMPVTAKMLNRKEALKSVLTSPTVVLHGSGLKAVGDGKIEGYLVRFTDKDHPDLYGDYFTKDTFYDVEPGDKVTLYYAHGMDPILGKRVLGKGIVNVDEVGLWVEAQLELRDEYERAIYSLAQKDVLGFSSGTLPFLVEYEEQDNGTFWIKSWPIGKDASLTPCPAAGPHLTAISAVKASLERVRPSVEDAGDASSSERSSYNEETKKLLRMLSMELDLY